MKTRDDMSTQQEQRAIEILREEGLISDFRTATRAMLRFAEEERSGYSAWFCRPSLRCRSQCSATPCGATSAPFLEKP